MFKSKRVFSKDVAVDDKRYFTFQIDKFEEPNWGIYSVPVEKMELLVFDVWKYSFSIRHTELIEE